MDYQERLADGVDWLLRAYRQSRQDLTDERRRRAAETANSRTDPLTSLLNRRGWDVEVDRLFRMAQRANINRQAETQSLVVIVYDLDHFKQANDRFGHAVGDKILRRFADQLPILLGRPTDILARTGGDEFAIAWLCESETVGAVASWIAERTRAAAAEHCRIDAAGRLLGEENFMPETVSVSITASIGIATLRPEAGTDKKAEIAAVQERADAAAYAAKSKGRNCVYIAGYDGRIAPIQIAPTHPPGQPRQQGGISESRLIA